MAGGDLLLASTVVAALAFDFTNGFHDTANAVATSVSTRALSPRVAVLLAATMNFAGAYASTAVALTVGKGIVHASGVTVRLLLAALLAAIAWNLATWWLGLPSSSTHALIGGLIGATIGAGGLDAVRWSGVVRSVALPAVASPLIGFAGAFAIMVVTYRCLARARPGPVNQGFRTGQIVSGSVMAFAHGANDAQKTMGVIVLALVASGHATSFAVPGWVIIASASTMAAGTYAGGWRIMRTLGSRVVRLEPPQGFAAQTAASSVLLATAALGLPVSTTQVISGSVVGAGSAVRPSAVRWALARQIVVAWAATIPATALLGLVLELAVG